MKKNLQLLAILSFLTLVSCQEKTKEQPVKEAPTPVDVQPSETHTNQPDYVLSPDHQTNTITLDIDGDGKPDYIQIVKSPSSGRYGITVKRATGDFAIIGPIDGSTHRVLPEDMEDILWAQDITVQEKNAVIYEVVDENGDLRPEEDVPEDEKITLPYESLHLSVPESCGSGLLYWLDGTYHWHQTS